MRLRRSVVVAAAALAVSLVVPGMASAHGTHVKAKMSGNQVVGQPGAPNGEGVASLHLLRQKSKVRFRVTFSRIGGTSGLNIGVYSGKRNENGALEFTLTDQRHSSPVKGVATGIPIQTLKDMTRHPRLYHVNVKNDSYPVDGAIRGQTKA